MARAGGMTVDGGDLMRYAEYAPKTNVKSDAEIDRRLVNICVFVESVKECNVTVNPNDRLRNGT